MGSDVVTVTSPPDSERIATEISAPPWISGAEQHDGQVTIRLHDAEEHITELIRSFGDHGYTITSVSIHQPTLEDVFLHYTGKSIRENEAGTADRMRMMMGGEALMDIVYTLWLRSLKRYVRSKSRIVGSLGMPVFFLLALGFGLNSVVQIPGDTGGNYLQFIIPPGIIAMSVLFTSVFSGIQIIWDKQFGFLKETLVAPVSRLEIMLGQTFGGATTAVIQGAFILILSLVIGIRFTSFTGFLIAFLFMALIGICFAAFGIAIASKMEDMHGFQLIMNFVVFPIFGLSGALFPPIESLPEWVVPPLTLIDPPLTYGVEGIRYGLLVHPPSTPPWSALRSSVASR